MLSFRLIVSGICIANGVPQEKDEACAMQVKQNVKTFSGVEYSTQEVRLPSGETLLDAAFADAAKSAREKLVAGAAAGSQEDPSIWGSHFSDVSLALPVRAPVLNHNPSEQGKGFVEGGKNMLGESVLTKGGRPCVVYGIGIDFDSSWEESMARDGCEVHAFDCTLPTERKAVLNDRKDFQFHDWCIGSQQGEGKVYSRDLSDKVFIGLGATMEKLGHSDVDVLKFDMEGFEWRLFEDDILKMTNPPEQLVFELHTHGAHPAAVPTNLVQDKGFRQVNELFLKLFDMDYRVASKEINVGDPACAEFVLVNVRKESFGA